MYSQQYLACAAEHFLSGSDARYVSGIAKDMQRNKATTGEIQKASKIAMPVIARVEGKLKKSK